MQVNLTRGGDPDPEELAAIVAAVQVVLASGAAPEEPPAEVLDTLVHWLSGALH